MEVLLVNPPARELEKEDIVIPPLGLAYLAAVIREAGSDVHILDAFAEGIGWDTFRNKVSDKKYDVIGFSSMTPVFDSVKRALPICRPYAKYLLIGGPHVTAFRDSVLEENPEADYAFYGEGEVTIVEFLRAIEAGVPIPLIDGMISREGIGAKRSLMTSLDELPFPARDLLPNERYRYPLFEDRRLTTIMSSRGCPYQCVFCDKGVFGSDWRARSAGNVLAEIDDVVLNYGVRAIVFYDDLFTVSKDRLEAICSGLIERGYDLVWKCEGRVNIVNEKSLELMRRAGCETIAYGVESGNPVGLEYLGKNTDPDMIREAFRKTHTAGIKSMGYFILGIPVETYEQAQNTIRFAIEIDADYAQFSILSPFPGSKLYDEAKANGWYHEVAAHNVHDKDNLRPVIISDNWSEEQLISIVREAHRKFYFRPFYMLKKLSGISSWKELKNLLGLGTQMIRYVFGSRC